MSRSTRQLAQFQILNFSQQNYNILGAFLLYHLASNRDKQEKLYQELENTLGPTGTITAQNITSLSYLKVGKTTNSLSTN
jgi:hypothetical protein